MTISKTVFCARIRQETTSVRDIIKKIINAWKQFKKTSDTCYLDSVALNLQNFYTAIEKIYTIIGKNIDKTIPEGSNWHSEILDQMTLEIKGVRPAVVSKNTKSKLEEYLGFRHVVRNVYSFNLNPQKIEPLVKNLQSLNKILKSEIEEFLQLIEKS